MITTEGVFLALETLLTIYNVQESSLQPKESTVPRVKRPDFNQSQNNIIVKMEPVWYLLPVRVTLFSGVANILSLLK